MSEKDAEREVIEAGLELVSPTHARLELDLDIELPSRPPTELEEAAAVYAESDALTRELLIAQLEAHRTDLSAEPLPLSEGARRRSSAHRKRQLDTLTAAIELLRIAGWT